MSEEEQERKHTRSRFRQIADDPAFLTALFIVLIAFQSFYFRNRLFLSADWRYALTFVAYSILIGFLFFQLRNHRDPKHHMEKREFDRLSLKHGLLSASLVGVYNLFEAYSDHKLNRYSIVGTAFACALVFVLGAAGVKNPPDSDAEKPLNPSGSRILSQPYIKHRL